MKKFSILLIFIVLLTTMIFSQTTITLWHSYRGDEKNALKEVVDNFNNKSSDVKIKLLGIPYDAFADKITAAIPRGKGPDLFIFAHDRIGGWVAADIIEPIDFYLEDSMEKEFVEGSYEPMKYDDSLYGLPMALKSVLLFYNTDLIPNPPKTTDEMIKIAKEKTNVETGKYGLVYEIANFYYHAGWMQGFGGKVFDENNKPVLNSPENIKSFQFAQDLFLKDKIVPPEVSNVLVTTLFNEKKAAMVISGPWFRGEISNDINYKVALLPIISPIGKRALPFMSSEGVLMSSKSSHKDEAFKIMKYLTSKEAAILMATKGKQPVANIHAYEEDVVSKDPYLPVFKEQIKYSKPMPSIPEMTFVWAPATTAINGAVNGADPKKELDEAQQKVLDNLKAAGLSE